MIKKVIFRVSAYNTPYQDETDEVLVGNFLAEDVLNIKELSTNLNLNCLRWISEHHVTFFNQKQVLEIIQTELPLLRKHAISNENLLQAIENISKMVFEGYQFLRFKPMT